MNKHAKTLNAKQKSLAFRFGGRYDEGIGILSIALLSFEEPPRQRRFFLIQISFGSFAPPEDWLVGKISARYADDKNYVPPDSGEHRIIYTILNSFPQAFDQLS